MTLAIPWVLLLSACGGSQVDDSTRQIWRDVQLLATSDFTARETATRNLIAEGKGAVGLLFLGYFSGPDAERRVRTKRILLELAMSDDVSTSNAADGALSIIDPAAFHSVRQKRALLWIERTGGMVSARLSPDNEPPEDRDWLNDAREVWFEDVELTRRGVNNLAMFPNLRLIRLRGTTISPACLGDLLDSASAPSILLTNVTLTPEHIHVMRRTAKLRNLLLMDMKLSDQHYAAMRGWDTLRGLGLFECRLEDRHLESVASMRGITIMRIRARKMSDDGLIHLQHMPQLSSLFLHATQVSKRGAAALRKEKPNCAIELLAD